MNTLEREMFTVVFFGKTGAGKSSTLNKMFDLELNTDAAIACTKIPEPIIVAPSTHKNFPLKEIRVVDMPGIGESIEADEVYTPFYEKWIPLANSLVWVTQADTRAYKRDQIFLETLIPLFHSSLFLTIALNKVDCLGVDEEELSFDVGLRQPSKAQLKLLPEKIENVYNIFN
jgi:predicted GTPase